MMPCQPHFVFGYAHSICLGGHYYLTNLMQETLQGLIHSFILHKFLTNISHPTRILLRRMVLFYHMGLIENEIPESGMLSISHQSISHQSFLTYVFYRPCCISFAKHQQYRRFNELTFSLCACYLGECP